MTSTTKRLLFSSLFLAVFVCAEALHATPVTLNLQLWLDADQLGLADGNPVVTWTDASGNSNDATRTTGAVDPIYVASGIGGKPVVRFDGTQIVTTPNFVPATPYTAYAVTRMEGTQNLRVISSDTTNWLMGDWSGLRDRMYAGGWVFQGPDAADTVPKIYSATGDGATTTFQNGGTTLASNGLGLSSPGAIAVGGYGFGAGSELSKADVAEVLVYDRVLTATEQNQVGQYLENKYSLVTGYTNAAHSKPIVDGSGAWTGGGGLAQSPGIVAGPFQQSNVTDAVLNDVAGSYWLGRQLVNNEHLTIDLGAPTDIERIDLQNSHNGGGNDRGTRYFNVQVSDDNVTFRPLLQGVLADARDGGDAQMLRFDVPTTTAQYVRFEAETAHGTSSGLNELRVFEDRGASGSNVALNRPIVDGSASWNNHTFDDTAGQNTNFTAQNVTDGSTLVDSGGNYWLGRNGVNGETFTVDLGRSHAVTELTLYNSNNGGDSSTNAFEVRASNFVDDNNQLVRPTTILDNSLADGLGGTTFNSGNGLTEGDYRYLQFVAKTFHPGARAGLNEIEVTGTATGEIAPTKALNVAVGRSVIDGSGAFNTAVHTAGVYNSTNIVDGATRDFNGTEKAFWLGRQSTVNEFLTLDLGEVRDVETIKLRNTHNGQSNDRGTRDFRIFGSTDNVNFVEILNGKLTTAAGGASDPQIPLDVFSPENGLNAGSYRYLRFETLSSSFGNNHVGLNEIQVFEQRQAPNVAAGKLIVDGSGSWQSGSTNPLDNTAFNAGIYPGSAITDQRIDDRSNGEAGEPATSYWLGRQTLLNEFLTVDLNKTFYIERIDLQNTHNRTGNDRATQNFTIEGSLDGVTFFPVFNDTLTNGIGLGNDMPIESFASIYGDFDPFYARFIKFTANDFYGAGGSGLNELFVFGVIPEPGTGLLLMIGGVLGITARRRRRR